MDAEVMSPWKPGVIVLPRGEFVQDNEHTTGYVVAAVMIVDFVLRRVTSENQGKRKSE